MIKKHFIGRAFKKMPKRSKEIADKIFERAQTADLNTRSGKRDFLAAGNLVDDAFGYLFNYRLWGGNDYNAFMKRMNTPKECGSVAIWRFDYANDVRPEDSWQPPNVTFERRNSINQFKGDCEDWACFFAVGLKDSEFSPRIMTVYPPEGSGHATCVYKDGQGDLCTVCTFFRIDHFTDQYQDVAKYWYDHGTFRVFRYDPTTFVRTLELSGSF